MISSKIQAGNNRLSPIEVMTKAYEDALESHECGDLPHAKRRPFAIKAAIQALIDYEPSEKMRREALPLHLHIDEYGETQAFATMLGATRTYLRAVLNETE